MWAVYIDENNTFMSIFCFLVFSIYMDKIFFVLFSSSIIPMFSTFVYNISNVETQYFHSLAFILSNLSFPPEICVPYVWQCTLNGHDIYKVLPLIWSHEHFHNPKVDAREITDKKLRCQYRHHQAILKVSRNHPGHMLTPSTLFLENKLLLYQSKCCVNERTELQHFIGGIGNT